MAARLTPEVRALRELSGFAAPVRVRGGAQSPSERQWTLVVPAPCDFINSNQRIHRMQEAKLTKAWRAAGFAAAKAAGVPELERAAIVAHVWKPRNGRYDPGNLYPTCKAVVDGFVDAGILVDDDWKHLDGPDLRHGGKGEAALVLTIHPQNIA